MLKQIKNVLQATPKGSYYESTEEQLQKIQEQFDALFEKDRSLFACSSLLESTNYAKGVMSHYLLSNPYNDEKPDFSLMESWNSLIEDVIILYNLRNMPTARAIKNLLFLAGRKDGLDFARVNNTRTRKIIVNYIFGRDDQSLEYLILKYRKKIRKLLKHSLGYSDLMRIVHQGKGYKKQFNKYFKAIDNASSSWFNYKRIQSILAFLCNIEIEVVYKFDKFNLYKDLVSLAKKGDSEAFQLKIEANPNIIPIETLEGLRNCFQLDVSLKNITENSNMSNKQKLRRQRSSKKRDVNVQVDYKKMSLYDLIKYTFSQAEDEGEINEQELFEAIEYRKEKEQLKTNLGDNVVVIIDKSDSMKGSKQRPLHPIVNALSIAYTLGDVTILEAGDNEGVFPQGDTCLATSLIEAVKLNPDTIVVISDGFENRVKGLFNHVYQELKARDYRFNLIHINPIYAANQKSTSLVKDIEPIAVDNNRMFETHLTLTLLEEKPELARELFITKLKNIMGSDNYEKLIQ
ncbi:MAG: hypothetical protein ACOCQR_01785 [bacterium]